MRWSRWTAAIRPDEARAIRLSFAAFFLLLSGYYLLRPVRDAWGLEGGTERLPGMFWATFVVTLLVIPVYSRLVARCPRRRIVPIVLHVVVACLIVFHLALRFDVPRATAGRVFFVWITVINLFIVAVFWSLMADLFRSEQARRLFGYIAGGGSAGAILGPLLAGQLAEPLGLGNLLLVSAVFLEACVWCVHRLLRAMPLAAPAAPEATRDAERIGGSVWAGFQAVFRQPYLAGIACQLLLTTSAATFLYLLQGELVSAAATGLEERLTILSHIEVATNVLGVLLQLLVTGPMLTAWGAGVPLRIVAGLLGGGLLLLAAVPSLLVLGVVQALRRGGHYALERPALNLLFTVVGLEDKYKAKGFIDTVVYRGGDALAASAFRALASAGLGTAALSLATVPFAAGGWWLAGVLSRRHRALERDTQLPLETGAALRHPAAQERTQ